MRLQITMEARQPDPVLPCNYQYPLSAAIYRILNQADDAYAQFLHDTGHRAAHRLKGFKLFSFSDLRMPFQIRGDRLYVQGKKLSFRLCFYMPDAADRFLMGLFARQQIEIADRISRASFLIQQAEVLPDPLDRPTHQIEELVLQPMSPLVVGRKNERGNYDFLPPDDPAFVQWLIYNWIEKYRSIHGKIDFVETTQWGEWDACRSQIEVQPLLNDVPYRSRLITIKAFTPQQTRIRGFDRFQLRVRAPVPLLKLALHGGLGLYNAMGMGYMDMAEKVEKIFSLRK